MVVPAKFRRMGGLQIHQEITGSQKELESVSFQTYFPKEKKKISIKFQNQIKTRYTPHFPLLTKPGELNAECGDLAYTEEISWRQKSKAKWSKGGDKKIPLSSINLLMGRKRKNSIQSLQYDGVESKNYRYLRRKSSTISSHYARKVQPYKHGSPTGMVKFSPEIWC